MLRPVFFICAMPLFNLGLAHSQTRDQTIVLALLGSVPGDRVDAERMSAVVALTRADDKTLDVQIKSATDQKMISIREKPQCIFSIGVKDNYYITLDFTKNPKIFSDGVMVWLKGKNVS